MIVVERNTPSQLSLDGQSYFTKKTRKQAEKEEREAKTLSFYNEVCLALYQRNLLWEAIKETRGVLLRWTIGKIQRSHQTACLEVSIVGQSLLGRCAYFSPEKPLNLPKREQGILKRAISVHSKTADKILRGEVVSFLPNRAPSPQQRIAAAAKERFRCQQLAKLLDPPTPEELARAELNVLLPQGEIWPVRR